jgi:ribose-phosphate pyrophosphokinase
MRGVAIFSGNSHPSLTKKICDHLSIPVGRSTLTKFSNRETNVMIDETVRDLDVFIIQTSYGNVNDMIIEMLIMISACKTASARFVGLIKTTHCIEK